tara:strand:- start:273 stop:722 length:450 start_codon:yes stop_codon:yes gene_type:complete
MAHFAEIDKDNKVIRVVVGCNQDIADNGGELSDQAATHFKKACPLSSNGVSWVQTSYNDNFRKKFAGRTFTYDAAKDKFIEPQPFPSWSLDGNDDWKAPVTFPSVITDTEHIDITWDETNQKWLAKKLNSDGSLIDIEWNPGTSSWTTV